MNEYIFGVGLGVCLGLLVGLGVHLLLTVKL